MNTTPHAQIVPGAQIGIVLSCPGKEEQEQGRPAAGITGDHLDELLSMVKDRTGRTDLSRDLVTITNAWTEPLSKGRDRISEASDFLILQEQNLERLMTELQDCKIIIVCGLKAQRAVRAASSARTDQLIIEIPHLGQLGLNSIKFKTNKERILHVANMIVKKIAA